MDNETQQQKANRIARKVVRVGLQRLRIDASLEAAGVVIEHRDSVIEVKGNTYPIKEALKAAGFKWGGSSKSWIYKLKTYSNFRTSHGGTRIQDCMVRTHPWPADWKPAAVRALAQR